MSPGQGAAAAIVRGHLLIQGMGMEMSTDMDTTDIPPSPTMDKPRLVLTKPRDDLPNQTQPINK